MSKFLINGDIPRDRWSSFVAGHPKGTVFQTPEMFDVYEKSSNMTPIAVALILENNIKGILLAAIMTNGGALFKMLTARSIITGGPLVENEDTALTEALLQEYRKCLPRFVIYSEIRPVFDPQEAAGIFEDLHFVRKGHYNLMMDIRLNKEQMWERMHKERRRNIIKAQKAGLLFRELLSEEDIECAIALIEATYRRKKVPMSYSETLTESNQLLDGNVRYFSAFWAEKMIASKVVLCYNSLVFEWFNGSDSAFFRYYPNDYLTWNIFCQMRSEGFSCYDFGGGGEPGIPYGVRDYKLKFGCEMHDYGRFLCCHKPLFYKTGKLAVGILKKQ